MEGEQYVGITKKHERLFLHPQAINNTMLVLDSIALRASKIFRPGLLPPPAFDDDHYNDNVLLLLHDNSYGAAYPRHKS